MKGQMFLITVVFLIGLIFFVQYALFQYTAYDMSEPMSRRSSLHLGSLLDSMNSTIGNTPSCDQGSNSFSSAMEDLSESIERENMMGINSIIVSYNLDCSKWNNIPPQPAPLNVTINMLEPDGSEASGAFSLYHTVTAPLLPPSSPSGLTAITISASRIDLAWTDTSNNEQGFKIERCSGSSCSNFTETATAGANTQAYQDTGRSPSTSYSYRVRAYNAAGDSVSYSNTASATTQSPPSTPSPPSGLTATAISPYQINLTWTDTSPNEQGFKIERCATPSCSNFTEITTVGANIIKYQDTGRSPSTSYTYRVRAYNAAGDSGYTTPTASATTWGITQCLVGYWKFDEGFGSTTADSSGNGNTGSLSGGATWTTGRFSGGLNFNGIDGLVSVLDSNSLDLGTQGTITAWIRRGNTGQWESIISKGTANSDQSQNYAMEFNNVDQLELKFGNGATMNLLQTPALTDTASFHHVAFVWTDSQLQYYLDSMLQTPTGTQTITPSTNNAILRIGQFSPDNGGSNQDPYNGVIDEVRIYNCTLAQADIQSIMNAPSSFPSAPSGLTATAVSSSQINLAWTDGSTNEDGFKIERCSTPSCSNFTQAATVGANTQTYQDTGRSPSTSYTYRVRAYNTQGDSGYTTPPASAITQAPPSPPSAPTGLGVIPSFTSQINLTWTDGSTNEDGFKIERCSGSSCSNFTEITTVGANIIKYQDTGRSPSTSYSYRVRAYNGAGDSGYSNTPSVTTLSGPAAAYNFNEGTGPNTADSSGNGHAGTLNGATWTTSGRFSNALNFDGSTAYVSVPASTSFNLGSAFTLVAWVRPTTNTGYTTVIQRSNTAQNWFNYNMYAADGDFGNAPTCTFDFNGDTVKDTWETISGTTQLTLSTWHHIACTYDGTNLIMYQEGVPVRTVPSAGHTLQISTRSMLIGSNDAWNEYYTGTIDEPRLYNRALTQAEIQNIMNNPM